MGALYLRLVMSLLLPMGLGYAVCEVILRRQSLPIFWKLSLSFGMGMGILCQWMLLLGIAGQAYTVRTIGVPMAIFTLVLCYFRFCYTKKLSLRSHPVTVRNNEKIDLFTKLILIYVAFNIYYVFWWACNIPLYSFDAFATFFFQAKIIADAKSLAVLPYLPHNNYPLHIPFVLVWIGLNLGDWNDQMLKAVFPLTFLFYLSAQYYFFRVFTTRRWSLIGLGMLCSANFFVYHALIEYRDFTMMFYNSLTLMLLLLWRKLNDDGWIYCAGLFAGFATFVKLEGVGYLGIHFVLFLVLLFTRRIGSRREVLTKIGKFAIPAFSICLIFLLYQYLLINGSSIQSTKQFDLRHLGIAFSGETLRQVPVVIHIIANNLFLSNNWNILWFILIVSILNRKRGGLHLEISILTAALILFFGGYILGFSFTQHFTSFYESDTVLSRVLLHFFPLTVMLIIFFLASSNPAPRNSE